jgi:hypothetical protein
MPAPHEDDDQPARRSRLGISDPARPIKECHQVADGGVMAWWGWVLIGWMIVAVVVALPLGLAIREADRRELGEAGVPLSSVVPRRRRVPVPPIAAALLGTGITLEAVGFVLRGAGLDRGSARLLSMDAPMSVPRLFITALFAASAVAAVIGGARSPGRRTWWLAVAAVSIVVTEVKGGGTVHVRALAALGVADHPVLAALGSTAVVTVVLGTLFWVSRGEQRDRRRVLLAFGLYGAAAVGLSALSSMAGRWATTATFVEESGEVLGAVAVLVSVLVGVAPRLVLPADWALRRTADAETIDAPGALPAWPACIPDPRG